MSHADMEAYVGRLHGFVISIEGFVSSAACDRAMHLVDRGEGPEGMLSMAWSIVNEGRQVPFWVIDTLRELAGGMVADEHWPADLESHGEGAYLPITTRCRAQRAVRHNRRVAYPAVGDGVTGFG